MTVLRIVSAVLVMAAVTVGLFCRFVWAAEPNRGDR